MNFRHQRDIFRFFASGGQSHVDWSAALTFRSQYMCSSPLILKTAPPNRSKYSDLHHLWSVVAYFPLLNRFLVFFFFLPNFTVKSPANILLNYVNQFIGKGGVRDGPGKWWCWKRKKRHRDDRIEPFQSCFVDWFSFFFNFDSVVVPKIRSLSFYWWFLHLFAVN